MEFGLVGTESKPTFFLSPDFKYVTPTLLDLQRDPLEEEHRRQKAVAAALSARKPPMTAGPLTSPVVVEFSDFQCPFCKRETDVLEKCQRRCKNPHNAGIKFPSPWRVVYTRIDSAKGGAARAKGERGARD